MSDSYFDDDDLLDRQVEGQVFWRLLGYIRPHLGLGLLALALVVLTTIASLAMPYAMRLVVGDVQPLETRSDQTPALWFGMRYGAGELVRYLALCFLAAEVLRFAATYAQGYVLQVLGQRVVHDIRCQVFGHLQRLELGYFGRHPVGRLVTRVAFDVEQLTEMFSQGLATVLVDIFMIAFIAAVMLWIDVWLALQVLVVLPLMVGMVLVFRRVMRRVFAEVARLRSSLNAYLAEGIDGIRAVQVLSREQARMDDFAVRNEALRGQRTRAIIYWACFMQFNNVMQAVAQALVIVIAGTAVVEGAIDLAVFTQFFFLVRMLHQPLRDLAEKYGIIQNATASADRIFKLLDEPEDPALATPRREGAETQRARGEVEFKDVVFSYVEGEPVLHGLSFSIQAGERIALVGHTGSGKSTIFNLLARFWTPDSGQILLDGEPLEAWHPHDLRRQLVVVRQEPVLFAGDIRTNITLGDDYSDEQVEHAAALVGADRFIGELDGGYGAEVVEDGATLSAGQRQLISFARAVLRDAPILALDEATSVVDTRTERQIQQALETLTSGRTALVIAHRLSTIQDCDRIFVLDGGRLVEQGSHQELLSQRGHYWRLYQLQYAGDAPAS